MTALGLALLAIVTLHLLARGSWIDLGNAISYVLEQIDERTNGWGVWVAAALAGVLLLTGCVFDVAARWGPPERRALASHISILRRGCYELTAGDLSIASEDRATSKEAGAVAVVAAGVLAGPAAAGMTAAGAIGAEAVSKLGTPTPDPPCWPKETP